jgi:holo-[acyl-carrier protein] synthase
MIIGIGVDLFSVTRAEDEIDRPDHGLRDQVFTPVEIAYCEAKRYPGQHYAARFAAKEAVFKALGAVALEGQHWREVEVHSDPHTGRSRVELHGEVKKAAEQLGARRVHISLSHARDWAVASVVLEGPGD